jgi:hypothetical protein
MRCICSREHLVTAASSEPVRLQVLVRKDARTPRGIAEAEAALRALGFEVTGTGRTSLSARATAEAFSAVFGDRPRALHVPPPLASYVESISIAPQHERMSRRRR